MLEALIRGAWATAARMHLETAQIARKAMGSTCVTTDKRAETGQRDKQRDVASVNNWCLRAAVCARVLCALWSGRAGRLRDAT